VVTSWGVRSGALAALWFVGICLLGVALWLARVVPRAAALTLAVSAVAFAAFAGPFVPVLDVLATIGFAAGYAWVGVALVTGANGQVERDAHAASPPSGRPPEIHARSG
jgi:hypothetical protein